jgi:hypothetical protein
MCFSRWRESARLRRHPANSTVVLGDFDVDDFGITRVPAAQFIAYGAGILWAVEPFLPFMIG